MNKSVNDEASAKERIYQAALRLFSAKGFHAAGVREIAAEADVNLATINYFYGSKAGLLKEIIDDFFDGLTDIVLQNLTGDAPVEVKLRRYIRSAAAYVGEKSEYALIIISQLPLDDPEVSAVKAAKVGRLITIFQAEVLDDWEKELGRRIPLPVLGPALMGVMLSHYLFRPIIERLGIMKFDDKFYEAYPELVAQVGLYGVMSLGDPELEDNPLDRLEY